MDQEINSRVSQVSEGLQYGHEIRSFHYPCHFIELVFFDILEK